MYYFIKISCSSDDIDSSNIVGTWKLSQVLSDPGDGSGTFVDVVSVKSITFLSDNTFSTNGNLCEFSSDISVNDVLGTYSIEEGKIYPPICENFNQVRLNYKIEEGVLIVSYPCIEACAEKYIKLRQE